MSGRICVTYGHEQNANAKWWPRLAGHVFINWRVVLEIQPRSTVSRTAYLKIHVYCHQKLNKGHYHWLISVIIYCNLFRIWYTYHHHFANTLFLSLHKMKGCHTSITPALPLPKVKCCRYQRYYITRSHRSRLCKSRSALSKRFTLCSDSSHFYLRQIMAARWVKMSDMSTNRNLHCKKPI